MDAPSHDTIDALLAELVPTSRLEAPAVRLADDVLPPAVAGPAHPPDGRTVSGKQRRRWHLRLALTLLAVGLAVALFAAGLMVGRRTANGADGANAGTDTTAETTLGSSPAEPFGSASVNSEAGDAAQTDPTGLVARYRDELAARDLVSTSLADDDLTRFGYAACVFAASAEGPADFDRFRATAAADADSSLSDAEMEVVIDTAVIVFCPVDAQRLGITG